MLIRDLFAPRLADVLAAHVAWMQTRGYARTTIAGRVTHLNRFERWCGRERLRRIRDVDLALLERYHAWISQRRRADGRPLSWSAVANQLTSLRMFFAWAFREQYVRKDPGVGLEKPRMPQRIPRAVLSRADAERVLAAADTRTKIGLRDRAIMELLYSSGIRRMELIQLDLGDLDLTRGVVLVREGKGRKDRLVPVGERAVEWIRSYLRGVRPSFTRRRDCGALFVTTRGTHIRPSRLTDRLHQYILRSGVAKHGSVHIFRHTMATLMHDGGADIRDIQELLGHAQLSTTQIYTRVSIRRLKLVHSRTHPASRSRSMQKWPESYDEEAKGGNDQDPDVSST